MTVSTSRVYVIGDPATDGPIKIGTTRQLANRLAAIKTGRGAVVPAGVNLAALEILHDYPGDRRLELELHRYYAETRLVGEWFDIPAENAHNVVVCYLADQAAATNITRRGTDCGCWRCRFQHAPDERPGDRPEWDDLGPEFLVVVHAITHARLGVDFADDPVALPASHCDIDRAQRLLSALRSPAPQLGVDPMPAATLSAAAGAILSVVNHNRVGTSFVEITNAVRALGIDPTGDLGIEHPRFDNLFLWAGINQTVTDALNELLDAKLVHYQPTSVLVYLADGAQLAMPIAKRAMSYKQPHWVPMVINSGPTPTT